MAAQVPARHTQKGRPVEVRIGVTQVAREVVFESTDTPEKVTDEVSKALEAGTPLSLTDERGHRVIVPADRLGYIDIGPGQNRRVGFSS